MQLTKDGHLCRTETVSWSCWRHEPKQFLTLLSLPYDIIEYIHAMLPDRVGNKLRLCARRLRALPRPPVNRSPAYKKLNTLVSEAARALSAALDSTSTDARTITLLARDMNIARQKLARLRSVRNVNDCELQEQLAFVEASMNRVTINELVRT